MATDRTKLWYIENFDPFKHMSDEVYRLIDENSKMRDVHKGETLYLQGSADSNVYMLKKGAVKITKLTPQGKELILDIVKAGAIFGEMGEVEPEMKDESAVVMEDGVICTMKKEFFDKALERMPGLSTRITKVIGFRRRKVENKLLSLLYSTVEQRLAKTLLNLVEDFGVPIDGGYRLSIKLTHKDIADLIASTRETVTAELNRLKSKGIIDFNGKNMEIKSVERLRALAR